MQVDSQMLAIGISSSSTRTKRPEFPRVPLNAYAPGDVNSFPFTCAFDSNSTTIAPHPSGYRLSIALDREGRAADDVHHSSRWRSGEKMSGVVEIVAPSPSSSIAARRMHSCSLRAFWQSTSIYQIARKEVDRNNTNVGTSCFRIRRQANLMITLHPHATATYQVPRLPSVQGTKDCH